MLCELECFLSDSGVNGEVGFKEERGEFLLDILEVWKRGEGQFG